MRNRYACLADLSNYFKKSELLGGLTPLEQEQVRINLGIQDYEGELEKFAETTYANLWDKVKRSQLSPGTIYAITDYQTIYESNVENAGGQKVTWGLDINPSETYTILVRAISYNQLETRAAILGKTWKVEYNVTRKVLDDGKATKGTITYLKDDNDNEAFYDFKNVKFRVSKQTLNKAGLGVDDDTDLYTFSDLVNGQIVDSSELHNTKFNKLGPKCSCNVFIGDTYYNVLEAECTNNLFAKGAHDCFIKWNTTGNRFNEPVTYLTGSIYNKEFETGNTVLSTAISKTVQKVNEATVVSFLDPITYTYQVILV